MEALYSKLYDKYTKLKTKRDTEMEELNRSQEEKFMAYASAADELIKHLRSENDRLLAEADDLRSEVTSIRSSRHEQLAEYQKFLMEERQKERELSQEIEKLRNLQREGLCCSARYDKNGQLNTPDSSQVGSDRQNEMAIIPRKRRRSLRADVEIMVPQCADDQLGQSAVQDSTDHLSKRSKSSGSFSNSDQPKCCIWKIDSSGGHVNATGTTICMFQELVECLVGMNVSIVTQADETCISAVHQSSGYSFSLTWIKNSFGDGELLYRALSLGTFERVAPEWMKEVLMFSTKMCPVFFQRVSRVVKLHP